MSMLSNLIPNLIAFFHNLTQNLFKREMRDPLPIHPHALPLGGFCRRVLTHHWKGASSRANPSLEGCTPVCPSQTALGVRRSG